LKKNFFFFRLCVSQLRQCHFNSSEFEALFGIFDGGFNNEIPSILQESLPNLLSQESKTKKISCSQNLKFALLKAHIATGTTGQKTGASAVVCHAVHQPDSGDTHIHVANIGHAEIVLSRGGEPVLLSRRFLATDDVEECERIRSVDGIITEDSLVNGSCTATRMIGCSYLFPSVIPEPHVVSLKLHQEDEFIVMANKALWDVMTYKEVVNEIRGLTNTILAAKKLVDLAQSYGARGNLSVIVVSFGKKTIF
jgi:PH domain and leucine-rich repeat-containing protein phosphatase